jgi:uncharacterized protein (DUF3084 family)
MNTTVKVFIVLVMIMAMIFAGTAMTTYAYRENWKRRWNDDTTQLAGDLKTATQKLANESFEKAKAQNAVSMLEQQVNQQQADLKKQEATISEKDKDIQNQGLQIAKMQADLAAKDEKIATLSGTLEITRTRNNELQHIASVARAVAHQLNLKLAEVEDDLHNASTALDKAKQDIAEQTKDFNDAKARLALVRDHHPEVFKEINGEPGSHKFLQGVVAAVNVNQAGQQDLIMLTIGKEEAVEEGVEFIIFRGNQYVVKVRAEKVLNDMVACRVIPESWNAKGVKVQINDLAQNRL